MCRGTLHGSQHIQERSAICPHCHASLVPAGGEISAPRVGDRDVRRGLGWRYWVVLALIGPLIPSIVWTCYSVPTGRMLISDRNLLLCLEFAVLDLLVITACMWPLHRHMAATIDSE